MKVDREQIESTIQNRLLSMQQTVNGMVNNFANFIDSLNPQQRQKLYQYIENHQSHFRCRH